MAIQETGFHTGVFPLVGDATAPPLDSLRPELQPKPSKEQLESSRIAYQSVLTSFENLFPYEGLGKILGDEARLDRETFFHTTRCWRASLYVIDRLNQEGVITTNAANKARIEATGQTLHDIGKNGTAPTPEESLSAFHVVYQADPTKKYKETRPPNILSQHASHAFTGALMMEYWRNKELKDVPAWIVDIWQDTQRFHHDYHNGGELIMTERGPRLAYLHDKWTHLEEPTNVIENIVDVNDAMSFARAGRGGQALDQKICIAELYRILPNNRIQIAFNVKEDKIDDCRNTIIGVMMEVPVKFADFNPEPDPNELTWMGKPLINKSSQGLIANTVEKMWRNPRDRGDMLKYRDETTKAYEKLGY